MNPKYDQSPVPPDPGNEITAAKLKTLVRALAIIGAAVGLLLFLVWMTFIPKVDRDDYENGFEADYINRWTGVPYKRTVYYDHDDGYSRESGPLKDGLRHGRWTETHASKDYFRTYNQDYAFGERIDGS